MWSAGNQAAWMLFASALGHFFFHFSQLLYSNHISIAAAPFRPVPHLSSPSTSFLTFSSQKGSFMPPTHQPKLAHGVITVSLTSTHKAAQLMEQDRQAGNRFRNSPYSRCWETTSKPRCTSATYCRRQGQLRSMNALCLVVQSLQSINGEVS